MPTYDYKCKKCEHCFELLTRIDNRLDACSEECPNCKEKEVVELQMSAPNLMNPYFVTGLKQPAGDFKERMKQIKHGHKYARTVKIKDY